MDKIRYSLAARTLEQKSEDIEVQHFVVKFAMSLAIMASMVRATSPLTFKITDLGPADAYSSLAINNQGQVVGGYNGQHVFFWDKGIRTDIGNLGGIVGGSGTWTGVTTRRSLNNLGQVVGFSWVSGVNYHAFLWQNGGITDLGTLAGAGATSWAAAINDASQVAGTSDTYGLNGYPARHAVRWQGGTVTDLGALYPDGVSVATGINGSGQVIGQANTSSGAYHAFLWTNNVMTDLGALGGSNNLSYPVAISDSGYVLGYSYDPQNPGSERAFIWKDNLMTDLGSLGLNPQAINSSAQVVGSSLDLLDPSSYFYFPFLWQNGNLTTLGQGLGTANDISETGQVVGTSSAYCQQSNPVCPFPFFWYNGQFVALQDLGYGLSGANVINKAAWIVGTARTSYGSVDAVLWTPDQHPPVAVASAFLGYGISPNNVNATVTLDGSGSSDPYGIPLSYTWFVNGNEVGTGVRIAPMVNVGTDEVRLDVNNGVATASSTISVTISTAAQIVTILSSQVNAANIPTGVKNTLLGDLSAAISSFNKGNFKTGVNQLQTFISDVNAQLGKKIDVQTAGGLIGVANYVILAVTAG